MSHKNIADLVQHELGDKEMADELRLHDKCNQEYAELATELATLKARNAELKAENKALRDGIVIVDCCPACTLKEAELKQANEVVQVLAERLTDLHVGCKEVRANSVEAWTKWAEAKTDE